MPRVRAHADYGANMTIAARRRWRIGLTIACAAILLVAGLSCLRGVLIGRADVRGINNQMSIARGALHFVHEDRGKATAKPSVGWTADWIDSRFGLTWSPRASTSSAPSAFSTWSVRIPLWIPFLLLASPCAWFWFRHYTRTPGICDSCGYDLRGLTTGKCPECGHFERAGAP